MLFDNIVSAKNATLLAQLFWSALTCQRFGRSRPVAICRGHTDVAQVNRCGDKSPRAKAVTGYRTSSG